MKVKVGPRAETNLLNVMKFSVKSYIADNQAKRKKGFS